MVGHHYVIKAKKTKTTISSDCVKWAEEASKGISVREHLSPKTNKDFINETKDAQGPTGS